MPRYEIRLMQTFDADDPVAAVERFIASIVDNGLRTFMYRVQDLDSDPNGSDLRYVQNRTALTIWEAADLYGVDIDLDSDDDDDDDDDIYEEGDDIGEFENDEDEESVVNIPSD